MRSQPSQPTERELGIESYNPERDYVAFNKALDIVRDAFLSLHAGVADEERWRWDTPVITFTWGNGVDIKRNLNGFVLGAKHPSGIEVESNAWADIREGKVVVRHWRHFSAGRLDATAITEESVAALVAKAYGEVTSWKKNDLEQREMLT
jgi:hypothetical protein